MTHDEELAEAAAHLARGKKVHEKKCWIEFFERARAGYKSADIRPDDADYQAGDELLLREYRPGPNDLAMKEDRGDGIYTGAWIRCTITDVLRGFHGIKEGYCVPSLTLGENGNNYAGFDSEYAGKSGS